MRGTFFQLLRSETLAAAVMSAAGVVLLLLAAAWMGWLGVGLVGLLVLTVSLRVEMFDDYSHVHDEDGPRSTQAFGRLLANQQRLMGAEMRLAERANAARRDKLFRVINAFAGAFTALGFGMYLIRLYA